MNWYIVAPIALAIAAILTYFIRLQLRPPVPIGGRPAPPPGVPPGAPSPFQRLRTWLQPNLGRLVFFVLITVPVSAMVLRHYGVIDNAMWYMLVTGNIGLGIYVYQEGRRRRAAMPIPAGQTEPARSLADIILNDVLRPSKKNQLPVFLSGIAVSELFALQFQQEFFGAYMRWAALLAACFFVALFVYIRARFAPPGVIVAIARHYCLAVIFGTAMLTTCVWLKNVYVGHIAVQNRLWPVILVSLGLFLVVLFCRHKAIRWRRDADDTMAQLQHHTGKHDKVLYKRAKKRYKSLGDALDMLMVMQALPSVVLAMGLVDGALWVGQKAGQIISSATAQQSSTPVTATSTPTTSTTSTPTSQLAPASAVGAMPTQRVVVEVVRRDEAPQMLFPPLSSSVSHAELQPNAELSEADVELIERAFDRAADRMQRESDRQMESLRR